MSRKERADASLSPLRLGIFRAGCSVCGNVPDVDVLISIPLISNPLQKAMPISGTLPNSHSGHLHSRRPK
jgi:hypothetical protein